MYELAEQHKGLLVNVEHRFYGDSFPFDDSSTARYAMRRQALCMPALCILDVLS
jgi:hypothetical protein